VVADTDREDCGSVPNTASVTTSNDGSDEASATVLVRCPEIEIDKTSNDQDGIVAPGQTVTFTIVATVADGPVTNAVLTDTLPAGQTYVAASQTSNPAATSFQQVGNVLTWTWASLSDGATVTYQVTIDDDAATGTQTNVAELCVAEVPDCDEDDVTLTVPELTIVKSFVGNTGGSAPDGTPEANELDVLTYTLTYTLVNGPVHNGVIADVLPVGLAYIDGTATGNAEFTFVNFDAGSRTLTWTAPLVTASSTVTYQVQVLEGSAELPQPLINVVTIVSDETAEDDDDAAVLVAEPPLEETGTPVVTLPPTNTFEGDASQGSAGFGLVLTLLGLAGFALVIGFITPVPERIRRREDRRR
jgi:fimbrial isopeptide formation D2 family protein